MQASGIRFLRFNFACQQFKPATRNSSQKWSFFFNVSLFPTLRERPESGENHFKAGLPNHPRTRPPMQKKSCKVNFMPHRSPLARTNELERFSRRGRRRERGAKQRGISLCEHSKRQSTVGEENSPVSSRTGLRILHTYVHMRLP